MNLRLKTAAALMSLAAWPSVAQQQQPPSPAPSALETLGAMRPTGSTADWPEVPQTGAKADKVKENLKRSNCRGFHIPFTRWCRMHATFR